MKSNLEKKSLTEREVIRQKCFVFYVIFWYSYKNDHLLFFVIKSYKSVSALFFKTSLNVGKTSRTCQMCLDHHQQKAFWKACCFISTPRRYKKLETENTNCISKTFFLLKFCSIQPLIPWHCCTFIIPLPLSFFAVSSCITTYKKTPPPVPPRTSTCSTASKPYISITAQSSTESAQVSH